MKGGSITKLILELIFSRAMNNNLKSTFDIFHSFENVYRMTYLESESIAKVIDITSERYLSQNLYFKKLKI
jgi:hypothetical protein